MNCFRRSAQLVAVVLLVMIGLTSCRNPAPLADDVIRVLKGQSKNVDELADSPFVPPHAKPHIDELPSTSAIQAEAVVLVQPALDVPVEQRLAFVDGVCQGVDAAEAVGDGPEAVLTWLVTQDDSWMSYSIQVDQLASNLMRAGSSEEAAAILARAAICQVASANS